MQHRGFDPPLRNIFLVEGVFPLELSWVLTPFLQNSFGWEYKLRSSLCTHAFHRADFWHSCRRRVNAGNKNTPSMHHPRRWNVTTSAVGLKNGHIHKSLIPNGEPQRYSWGTQKKKPALLWMQHDKEQQTEYWVCAVISLFLYFFRSFILILLFLFLLFVFQKWG